MIFLKKFKADIEQSPYGKGFGMTIEFWAESKDKAEEKLNELVKCTDKNWYNLEEMSDVE